MICLLLQNRLRYQWFLSRDHSLSVWELKKICWGTSFSDICNAEVIRSNSNSDSSLSRTIHTETNWIPRWNHETMFDLKIRNYCDCAAAQSRSESQTHCRFMSILSKRYFHFSQSFRIIFFNVLAFSINLILWSFRIKKECYINTRYPFL